MCLEPQTTIKKWMFGETTISYVKIGNHPIETTIYKLLFGVPVGFLKGTSYFPLVPFSGETFFKLWEATPPED